LVAGYTGPGGKTVLPHKAVAKIDMRLVAGHDGDRYAREAASALGEARVLPISKST